MDENHHGSSFSNIRAYSLALIQTPKRFALRAGSVATTYEEMTRIRTRSGSNMQKTLRWYDLIGLGLGGMVGAGVFVTTGRAARLYAGPSIVLSYAISGLCALLSAFCYTEFAVDMPVAGGAFSYLRVTFEFAAFITGANLVTDYVLSNAAIARSFTAYLGTSIGIDSSQKWRITIHGLPDGFNQIDFIAVAVILIITVCICYSTKESSMLNIVLTILHIVFILFIIIIGFTKGDWKNFVEPSDPKKPNGFFPYGATGVFNGAAMVYLSYIGYDAVSTMAEEVRNPTKDIPIGVSGSVVIVTVLYCLMGASLSKLLPYDMIDTEAPFSTAFQGSKSWGWMSNVVGVGASFGILTSIIVAMLGQARYLCVIGRSNVVPSWFAKVNPKTSTPVNASAFLGILTAAISLFTDLNILLNLVSIGTLFVFYMVGNAVIYRRYVTAGVTNPWHTRLFLLCFTFTAIIFTLTWQLVPPGKPKVFILVACTVIAFAFIQLFQFAVPQVLKPQFWGVPLMPWIPSISIFLNVFLLGSLDKPSYVRFGIFSGLTVLVYLLYSVHASFDAEGNRNFVRKDVEMPNFPDENDHGDDVHV
ncbi:hypothetical protein AQUCO_00400232v1 [Aquilegia coerulea]|uniref:Cationic amino acid transporter C-terminal domain-containing protein n=1 Tax=Aquilegia coerulea TaxID=218851 RepID=A0A2G5EU83_AQUCA|nr:hypothetical protein AQUCO_00400232v1 [Aquilegia coerulea]